MPDFVPTECPFLPLPTPEQAQRILESKDGPARLAEYLTRREEQIKLALDENNGEPYHYGFDLGDHWADAISLLTTGLKRCSLETKDFLYVAGGKRASKSEWAAKWVVRAAVAYPKGIIWCFQDSEATSIATQQKLIWKYLPREFKALRGKRHHIFKVNYSQANGFADRKLILPNGTELWFLTYNQEVADYQGWKIGAPVQEHERKKWINVADRKSEGQMVRFNDSIVPIGDPEYKDVGVEIPNIGAWCDENLSIEWWETVKFRRGDYKSKVIWTYSPLFGITEAVKEFKGTPKLIESREAELLPSHKLANSECPRGQMPYIEQPVERDRGVIYFFSKWNPFENCYQSVKQSCAGKASEYVERNAYGYARDTRGRCFPLFGGHNIVKETSLPETGRNYCFCDPAGDRNWCFMWVRVTNDKPAKYFVYRDWPDARTYGEWALPAQRAPKGEYARQWDGVPGPAQASLGYGIGQYKLLVLDKEKIGEVERDPYRVAMKPKGQEKISERIIDSRAGAAQHAAEGGSTCLLDRMREHSYKRGSSDVEADPMEWVPAPGVREEEGLSEINSLLNYNYESEIIPIVNEPRLYVSERCQQVIWALAHYTGRGGSKGACKDWIDLLRYMALGLLDVKGNIRQRVRKGVGY